MKNKEIDQRSEITSIFLYSFANFEIFRGTLYQSLIDIFISISNCQGLFYAFRKAVILHVFFAQSPGAVEYTDFFSVKC